MKEFLWSLQNKVCDVPGFKERLSQMQRFDLGTSAIARCLMQSLPVGPR
jgi:hypothetical protein